MSNIVDFKKEREKHWLKKCMEQPGGMQEIEYSKGGHEAKILAPLRDVQRAIIELHESESKRKRIMRSVNSYLDQNFPKVMEGKADQKTAMNVCQDIAIWYANELIEEDMLNDKP